MIVDRPGVTTPATVVTVSPDGRREVADNVATEEPLEIRLRCGPAARTAAITMRTPGADFELTAGFLFSEGIVTGHAQIREMTYCLDGTVDPEQQYNVVSVELSDEALPAVEQLERHFVMNSACGVCGKAAIERLAQRARPLSSNIRMDRAIVASLPEKMRVAQRVFAKTGGLHASALFRPQGELVATREDVGRHNALDKIIGWAYVQDRLPLDDCVLLVSGRASYELVQKCVTAGIAMLCAVSAPSSLAVQTAQAFNVTLCGFLRDGTFNVYSGGERIN